MQQEKIKTLLVNILTAVVVVGVVVTGYFVFTKTDAVSTVGSSAPVTAVAVVAQETAAIGNEIDNTVRDLGGLERAVASSVVIFDLPAFKNLENFSVTVSPENLGRANPFTPTTWKIKLNALETSISGNSAAINKVVVPPATSSTTAPAVSSQPGTGLLGDFSPGI